MPYKVVFLSGLAPNIENKLDEMEEEGWDFKHAYAFSEHHGSGMTPNTHALIFHRKS